MVSNNKTLFFIICICIVVLDQLTKWMATLYFKTPVYIFQFFDFRYSTNKGVVFGFLQNYSWIPLIVSIIVIAGVLYYQPQIGDKTWPQVLFSLILAGAIGNLIDRIVHGFVIDFINFSFWPTFNIADSAITIGAIGLIIWCWKEEKK